MTIETRTVTDDEAEIRLDRWFRRHFPQVTQGAIQKLCRTGQVRVDGKRVEAAIRLLPGQAVRIPPLPEGKAPAPERAPDPHLQAELEQLVLHRDAQVIVLNKPYGLPVQGGPGITRHLDGMLDVLAEGGERPRLVHRLDRDTTGVLLLARTAGVAAKLAASFRGRDVRKVYWALVVGRPMPLEGRIDLSLVREAGPRGGRTAVAGPYDEADAARAVTEYRTVDYAGKKVAWLELFPLTGRTHQLRVHCAAMGTPIIGDTKYGEPEQVLVAALPDKLHLHARRLVLPHPAGGVLDVTAPPASHFRESLATLGFSLPSEAAPGDR
jgi:23S rRNA pseudouridine955/2504/2580 synthase